MNSSTAMLAIASALLVSTAAPGVSAADPGGPRGASCIIADLVFDPNSASAVRRWASDVFAARVVSVGGAIGNDRDDPRTSVRAVVTKTYKGSRSGTVEIAAWGKVDCLVNNMALPKAGGEYIFATSGTKTPLLEAWNERYSVENDREFSR